MKILLYITSIILLSGCAIFKGDSTANENTDKENINQDLKLTATIGKIPSETDSYTVLNAEVKANTLELEIQYGGGCKDHIFECIGDEAIMKSNPPKRMVKLIHENNQDECKALITKKISIDIRSLSITETKGSEIILLLHGWDGELRYIFE